MKVVSVTAALGAALVLAAGMSACGDSGNANPPLGITNVSPLGSVGGLVVDASTMKPLKDVAVTVVAGGQTFPSGSVAKTDASGYFSIKKVPSGSLIVRIKPPSSYLSVDLSANLANAAGEFPLGNATLSVGPIGLVPVATATTAFGVQLVQKTGAAAPSLTAYLRASIRYLDLSTGNPRARGVSVVKAKSGNTGVVRFVGMPDFTKLAGLVGTGGISDLVRVRVPPYGKNGDGSVKFMGKEVVFNVTQLKNYLPTIVLTDTPPTTLKIEAASIAAFTGTSAKGNRVLATTSGPLYLAFNWPISQKFTRVFVYNENGVQQPNPKVQVAGNLLTVTFSGAIQLQRGAEYNVNVHAVAVANGALLKGDFGAPLFTPATMGSKVSATVARASSDPSKAKYSKLIVTFSEPIGTGIPDRSLVGADSVLFFGYDINGSGTTGDAPNENGFNVSTTALTVNEKDPPGKAGKSGFATTWSFNFPTDKLTNPLPSGTPVKVLFSHASVSVERASGELVGDAVKLTLP